MKLVYNIFRGIRPRQSPRSLPTGYAQTATNVRALSDDLESWREPGEEQTLAKGGVIRSLFLMARQYWLHWTEEVEVARGPIPPGTDDSERTYITGLDRPRMTNVALATTGGSGGAYPYATVALGMPAPDTAVTVDQTVSGNLDDEELLVSNGGDLDAGWEQLIGGEAEDSTENVIETEDTTAEGEIDVPFIRMRGSEHEAPVIYRDVGIEGALASRYRVEYGFDHTGHFDMMFVIAADEDGNGIGVSLEARDPFPDYSDSVTTNNAHIRLYAVSNWRDRTSLLSGGGVVDYNQFPVMLRASGQTIQVDANINPEDPDRVILTMSVDVLTDVADDYSVEYEYELDASQFQGGFFAPVAGVESGSSHGDYIGSLTVAAFGELADGNLTSYVRTFINQFGEESAPSPSTAVVNLAEGVDTTITAPDAQPGDSDFQAYGWRLYRAATGATGSALLFHTETLYADPDNVLASELVVVDTLDDDDLGEPLESELFDLPPVDGRNVIALPNGVMVMSDGNQVCPSVRYRPHAYPVDYRVTTDYDVVALAAINTTVYALTQSHAYMIIGDDPSAFSMAKIPQAYACVSRRSVAALARYGVLYACPDGLVVVNTTGAQLISEPWIKKREWQQFSPESIVAAAHDDIYFGFYDDGAGGRGGFVFDPRADGFGFAPLTVWADAVFVDALTDRLYFAQGDVLYSWEGGTGRLDYTWRGRLEQLPRPAAFNAARVDAQDYDDVTARYYGDGELVAERTVTGPSVFRLPPLRDGTGRATTYRDFEVEISGNSRVYSAEVATSVAELS